MKDRLLSIVALVTIVSALFGGFFFFENRYALSEVVAQIEQRLDYKIVADQYWNVQKRIWTIEERYPIAAHMPTTTCEELRELKVQSEVLKEKLEVLEGKAKR